MEIIQSIQFVDNIFIGIPPFSTYQLYIRLHIPKTKHQYTDRIGSKFNGACHKIHALRPLIHVWILECLHKLNSFRPRSVRHEHLQKKNVVVSSFAFKIITVHTHSHFHSRSIYAPVQLCGQVIIMNSFKWHFQCT